MGLHVKRLLIYCYPTLTKIACIDTLQPNLIIKFYSDIFEFLHFDGQTDNQTGRRIFATFRKPIHR
jgi:hypothetical protein